MKKYFKSFIFLALFVSSFCIFPQMVSAQDIGSPDEVPEDGGSGDPDAPIDAGVGLLIAAGVVYGVKKIREERKSKLDILP